MAVQRELTARLLTGFFQKELVLLRAMALVFADRQNKESRADFKHYRVVEFDKYAISSYNAIHGTDFPTMDITQISGDDLGIVDTDKG